MTLARQVGVSRGTVRQALALLLREGLVRTVPGRGTFAASASDDAAVVRGERDDERRAGGRSVTERQVTERRRENPRAGGRDGGIATGRLVGVVTRR